MHLSARIVTNPNDKSDLTIELAQEDASSSTSIWKIDAERLRTLLRQDSDSAWMFPKSMSSCVAVGPAFQVSRKMAQECERALLAAWWVLQHVKNVQSKGVEVRSLHFQRSDDSPSPMMEVWRLWESCPREALDEWMHTHAPSLHAPLRLWRATPAWRCSVRKEDNMGEHTA
jgi:hypothetical protein